MNCPACQTDNPGTAARCTACGRPLASSRSRRCVAEESDSPFSGLGEGRNRPARLAYYMALVGLVPGLGLVLGPAAALLGIWARRRGRNDPAFTGQSPATAALVLGALLALTNWAGLALMIAGWPR
jgi:hypothetical protein